MFQLSKSSAAYTFAHCIENLNIFDSRTGRHKGIIERCFWYESPLLRFLAKITTKENRFTTIRGNSLAVKTPLHVFCLCCLHSICIPRQRRLSFHIGPVHSAIIAGFLMKNLQGSWFHTVIKTFHRALRSSRLLLSLSRVASYWFAPNELHLISALLLL